MRSDSGSGRFAALGRRVFVVTPDKQHSRRCGIGSKPLVRERDSDSVEQFDEIQKILFSELVLRKTEKEWPLQYVFKKALPFFRIVPTCDAPIMNNPRSLRETGYWDHSVNRVKPGEADLLFIAYFDWNRMDYVDLRYYRVKIIRFDGHSDVVGREALIDRDHSSVQLAE
jgi:hypothetical protein